MCTQRARSRLLCLVESVPSPSPTVPQYSFKHAHTPWSSSMPSTASSRHPRYPRGYCDSHAVRGAVLGCSLHQCSCCRPRPGRVMPSASLRRAAPDLQLYELRPRPLHCTPALPHTRRLKSSWISLADSHACPRRARRSCSSVGVWRGRPLLCEKVICGTLRKILLTPSKEEKGHAARGLPCRRGSGGERS